MRRHSVRVRGRAFSRSFVELRSVYSEMVKGPLSARSQARRDNGALGGRLAGASDSDDDNWEPVRCGASRRTWRPYWLRWREGCFQSTVSALVPSPVVCSPQDGDAPLARRLLFRVRLNGELTAAPVDHEVCPAARPGAGNKASTTVGGRA